MKRFLLSLLILGLCFSCEQLEQRFDSYNYPGDKFSRTVHTAKSSVETAKGKTFIYELSDGRVLLKLNDREALFVDQRGGRNVTIPASQLHHGKIIDSSLRYFIRSGMTLSDIRLFLGEEHDKWGNVGNTMPVWNLADGRKLTIVPSTLTMPEGMQSYNLLNEYGKLDRVVKIPVVGE